MLDDRRLPASTPGSKRVAARANEFLTFRVGKEHYGVEILKVQEIRRSEPVKPIANSPAFVKGIINLRGTIVPIIDMRIKLNSAGTAHDDLAAVIVLNVGRRVIGAVVDGVSEVVELGEEDFRPLPDVSMFATHCILGIGTHADRMLILMNIEKLLTEPDMALVDGLAH